MASKGRVLEGLCLIAAAGLGPVSPAQAGNGGEGVTFYSDQFLFLEDVESTGKIGKAIWDLKPVHLPDGTAAGAEDMLDIISHTTYAFGVWYDGATNLWPPEVDNVQFSSNMDDQGGFEPNDDPFIPGLFYATSGFQGLINNMLGANAVADSFDILSGPPAGGNHTAMSLRLIQLPGFGFDPPEFHVTVYDKNEVELGGTIVFGLEGEEAFLGIITNDPGITIGRVDIRDASGGFEGITHIALYQEQEPVCPWDCASPPDKEVSVVDFLALLARWGQVGESCDFDGNGVDITDFLALLAHWGPCPAPPSDECADAILFDLRNQDETIKVFFDMHGATSSPEPPVCNSPDNKDIWYGLSNQIGVQIRVTITTTVPLAIEVYNGCSPENLVACTQGTVQPLTFALAPEVQARIRLINEDGLPNDELKGHMIVQAAPLPPGCPGGGGDCCSSHATPGCDDIACCGLVCDVEPMCCDAAWDEACAVLALTIPQCDCSPPTARARRP
jgi:hypothetical protein